MVAAVSGERRGDLGEMLARAGLPVRVDVPGSPAPEAGGPGTAGTRDAVATVAATGRIVLRRERKGRGGKTVTVVTGLPRGSLDDLAREMRRALGCGASVEDGAIILLGDLAERARTWLAGRGARRVVLGN